MNTEGAGGKYSQGTDGHHRLQASYSCCEDNQHTDPLYTHTLLLENLTYQRSLVLHLAFHLEIRRGMPRLKEINQIRALSVTCQVRTHFSSVPSHYLTATLFLSTILTYQLITTAAGLRNLKQVNQNI